MNILDMAIYPFWALIVLLILLIVSYVGTMWRLTDNKKKYGTWLRRDKNGRIT